jgi:ABC-type multidrug transport system ATPase subunit
MSFLKKIFKSNKQNKPKISKNTEITLNSSNSISHNALKIYTIIGKQGFGKTTLSQNLQKAFADKPIVTVKTIDDLNVSNAILVIDDLKTSLAREVMHKIVDILRVARHRDLTIILTHHLISQVPSEILQLSQKVIFFNTNFNPSQNSKLLNIISKNKLEKLHELLLSLEKYQYIVIENNKVYGVFNNTDITPIINKKPSKEISLNGNSDKNSKTQDPKEELRIAIKALIPQFQYLTITQQIIALYNTFHLKPKAISEILGTTPECVRNKLSQYRRGLIKA